MGMNGMPCTMVLRVVTRFRPLRSPSLPPAAPSAACGQRKRAPKGRLRTLDVSA